MTKIKIILSLILVILITLTTYGLWQYPVLRENLGETWRLATTRIPENLTELYFENHLELPKTMPETESIPYSFTIHNLENKKVEYTYIVYAKNEKGETMLTKGKVALDHDKYQTIESSVAPGENLRTRIIIQLTGESTQEIAFWLEARQ